MSVLADCCDIVELYAIPARLQSCRWREAALLTLVRSMLRNTPFLPKKDANIAR